MMDNLILNQGVRHDHFSTVGGTTNPRLAVIWSPYDETTVKLLYGAPFRAPNPYELYFHDGGGHRKRWSVSTRRPSKQGN